MDRLPPTPASPVLTGGGLLHGLTAGYLGLDPVAVVLTGVAEDHEARW